MKKLTITLLILITALTFSTCTEEEVLQKNSEIVTRDAIDDFIAIENAKFSECLQKAKAAQVAAENDCRKKCKDTESAEYKKCICDALEAYITALLDCGTTRREAVLKYVDDHPDTVSDPDGERTIARAAYDRVKAFTDMLWEISGCKK
ncbi:MAG: hypothetical protein H7Y07_10260 [Pyrinomonadaceae bacterium]|nr:hypothetical protein [Sphingobacteriaceae bacterium]